MQPNRNPVPNRNRRPRRTPEQSEGPERRRGQFGWLALTVLLGLMVAPALALHRLCGIWGTGIVLGSLALLSALTYAAYSGDKRKAEAGAWRTPESTLHFLEFAGGWPAAFVAQRKLRHKISKRSYQYSFWFIIVLHQIVATDFVLDWKYARLALGKELIAELEGKPSPSATPPARVPVLASQQTPPPPPPRANVIHPARPAKTPATRQTNRAKSRAQ